LPPAPVTPDDASGTSRSILAIVCANNVGSSGVRIAADSTRGAQLARRLRLLHLLHRATAFRGFEVFTRTGKKAGGGPFLASAPGAASWVREFGQMRRLPKSYAVPLRAGGQGVTPYPLVRALARRGAVRMVGDAWKACRPAERQLLLVIPREIRRRTYDIKPAIHRIGDETARGYTRAQFADAWSRYVPQECVTSVTPATCVDCGTELIRPESIAAKRCAECSLGVAS
jgi:hypothetical protein